MQYHFQTKPIKSHLNYFQEWSAKADTDLKVSRKCKVTFPKSLITVILKRTITTNHSAIILTAAYQYSLVKGTLLSGSSGYSFSLLLFCIKEKKTAFHLFFQLFLKPFLSFLLICHEVWPELLFICRPGWSFFHSLSFTAVDFCMVCASACLSVLVTYLHKGGTREGWGFGERMGWKLFFPPLFLVSTQTDWCSWRMCFLLV